MTRACLLLQLRLSTKYWERRSCPSITRGPVQSRAVTHRGIGRHQNGAIRCGNLNRIKDLVCRLNVKHSPGDILASSDGVRRGARRDPRVRCLGVVVGAIPARVRIRTHPDIASIVRCGGNGDIVRACLGGVYVPTVDHHKPLAELWRAIDVEGGCRIRTGRVGNVPSHAVLRLARHSWHFVLEIGGLDGSSCDVWPGVVCPFDAGYTAWS